MYENNLLTTSMYMERIGVNPKLKHDMNICKIHKNPSNTIDHDIGLINQDKKSSFTYSTNIYEEINFKEKNEHFCLRISL